MHVYGVMARAAVLFFLTRLTTPRELDARALKGSPPSAGPGMDPKVAWRARRVLIRATKHWQ